MIDRQKAGNPRGVEKTATPEKSSMNCRPEIGKRTNKTDRHGGNKTTNPVLSAAAEILLNGEKQGAQLYSQLHAALEKCDLSSTEKAKVTALVTGVCEHLLSIDYILNLFSKTKTEKMKPQIRAILRLGVCQLVFMERTADASAVSNCVELARERGFSQLTGYVNGVLRTVGRKKNRISYPDLSTRYSMPVWICNRLEDRFGKGKNGNCEESKKGCFEKGKNGNCQKSEKGEENRERTGYGAEQILQYFEQENTVTIRLDERLSARESETLIQRIKASSERIGVYRHPLLPYAYVLEHAGDIRKLPGFGEGAFYVQDAGAQLVVELTGIRAGDTIIDVCAAPGGKSVHAYLKCTARLPDATKSTGSRYETAGKKRKGKMTYEEATEKMSGRVIAMDLTERKCAIIRENAKRLHTKDMEICVHDARTADERFLGIADVVICDLPCSGLGIMGRKADIRYRLREEDITELAALQREILRASISYLKKGGTLLYSTCTLTPEENEENVRFISDELGLEPVDLTEALRDVLQNARTSAEIFKTCPSEKKVSDGALSAGTKETEQRPLESNVLLREESLRRGYLTLLPGRFLTDGFFMARFRM